MYIEMLNLHDFITTFSLAALNLQTQFVRIFVTIFVLRENLDG